MLNRHCSIKEVEIAAAAHQSETLWERFKECFHPHFGIMKRKKVSFTQYSYTAILWENEVWRCIAASPEQVAL
jgi:hypothetical protein